MAHVPQLWVTLLALDEKPTMCCTSPAPLNCWFGRAFWGGAASCQVLTRSQAPSPGDVPLPSCTSDSWHPTVGQWCPSLCPHRVTAAALGVTQLPASLALLQVNTNTFCKPQGEPSRPWADHQPPQSDGWLVQEVACGPQDTWLAQAAKSLLFPGILVPVLNFSPLKP